MEKAFHSISNIALRSQIRDDDGVDQLHHFVTVTMLAAFAAITGVAQYLSEPINCWSYGEYSQKHYQDHVNQYCWTHKLYHYPSNRNRNVMPYNLTFDGTAVDLDVDLKDKQYGKINFYRWITIIFIIQGFCFKLPNLMWSEYNMQSGSNLVKMVEVMQNMVFIKEQDKKEKLREVALFLEQWLRIHRKPHWFLRSDIAMVRKTLSWCTLCIGDNMSRNLTNVYLLTKLVFLLNTVSQFVILSAWLQIDFYDFGIQTLKNYAQTRPVDSKKKTFPLVALCHFETIDQINGTSAMAHNGRWVQCILTINIFLEKLFLVEWFWLQILFLLTCISFVRWCFKIMRTNTTVAFVQRFMKLMGYYNSLPEVPSYCSEEQFVTEFLLNDGVFVLRILAVNTNEVVVSQLVEEMWKRYVDFAKKSVEAIEKNPKLLDRRPTLAFFRKFSRSRSLGWNKVNANDAAAIGPLPE